MVSPQWMGPYGMIIREAPGEMEIDDWLYGTYEG